MKKGLIYGYCILYGTHFKKERILQIDKNGGDFNVYICHDWRPKEERFGHQIRLVVLFPSNRKRRSTFESISTMSNSESWQWQLTTDNGLRICLLFTCWGIILTIGHGVEQDGCRRQDGPPSAPDDHVVLLTISLTTRLRFLSIPSYFMMLMLHVRNGNF